MIRIKSSLLRNSRRRRQHFPSILSTNPSSNIYTSRSYTISSSDRNGTIQRESSDKISAKPDALQQWIESFLLSYFRKGVARRIYGREQSLMNSGIGKPAPTSSFEFTSHLAKDLMRCHTLVGSSRDNAIISKPRGCCSLSVTGSRSDGISEEYLGRKIKVIEMQSVPTAAASSFASTNIDTRQNLSLTDDTSTDLTKYFHRQVIRSSNGASNSQKKALNVNIHDRYIDGSSQSKGFTSNFDAAVFMPDYLSGLSGPQSRLAAIQTCLKLLSKAELPENASTSDLDKINCDCAVNSSPNSQPHSSGLLMIIERCEVFRRREANDLISGWKLTLEQVGFKFLDHKYVVNNAYHALIFRKIENDHNSNSHNCHDINSVNIDSSTNRLWFDIDFEADPSLLSRRLNKGASHAERSGHSTSSSISSRNSNNSPTLPVGIVGAGIGGSALALLLQRRKIPFIVFDKDLTSDSRKQGYALTMQQAAATLEALQIHDEVSRSGVVSYCSESRRYDGSTIGLYGPLVKDGTLLTNKVLECCNVENGMNRNNSKKDSLPLDIEYIKKLITSFALQDGHSRHNLHIPRQELRRIIVNKIQPESIRWNSNLTSLKFNKGGELGDHVELKFKQDVSGSGCDVTNTVQCSMVVGADGIYSSLRRILSTANAASHPNSSSYQSSSFNIYSDIGPFTDSSLQKPNLNYLGLMVILGYSLKLDGLDTFDLMEHKFRKQIQWVDGATRVFTMPFDERYTMWQLSFPISEIEALHLSNLPKVEVKQTALRKLAGWDSHLLKLIETTDLNNFSCHPAYDMPTEAMTHKSLAYLRGGCDDLRLTFLGDAVHPMSPFKGQGANQALLDALSLCKHIVASDLVHPSRATLSSSLRAYEDEMLVRSKGKVLRSRDAALSLHSPDALVEANVTRAVAAETFSNKRK